MNKIKELRQKFGYTQTKLAKLLCVTQANLSGWELDKWQPDNEALKKMADLFGVSIDYLVGRETNEEPPIPKKNTVISIGRGGERREYEISDEDAAIVDAFLEKMRKKD